MKTFKNIYINIHRRNYNSQKVKITQTPMNDEWINKTWYIHITVI